MGYLFLLGVLAGAVVAVSPCVVPVLPIILSAGVTSAGRRRPLLVVSGLVISFTAIVLFGAVVLSDLGLPKDFLRDVALALLILIGVGMLVPSWGALLERPFAKIQGRAKTDGGSLVLGLSLGAVYVPCAGPVLAAITVAGAQAKVGLGTAVLAIGYAVGTAVPLLVIAAAATKASLGSGALKRHTASLRKVAGVVIIVTASAMAFNWFRPFQTYVPGYTSALQNHIESNTGARSSLEGLSHAHGAGTVGSRGPGLSNYGQAPAFTKITKWLNTPRSKSLTFSGLKGKVVLVDFWTYSCINCLRSLPHVEAWYSEYAKDGLVVVGVHTPEFPFEYVVPNVEQAVQQLGVKYPVAIDDNYGTWNAYGNQYWPAEYLIDGTGEIRHVSYGEGGYSETEKLIRELLAQRVKVLPPSTSVSDTAPSYSTTPESYLGYNRLNNYVGNPSAVVPNRYTTYSFPTSIPQDSLSLSGSWKVEASSAVAGNGAQLELNFAAKDVYLVMGGNGTVSVTLNGVPQQSIYVNGIPDIHQVVNLTSPGTGIVTLSFTGNVQAYDFTFG